MVMIFLSGGGSAEQSYELDKQFFSGDKVLYIPFAMNEERYDACCQWFSTVAQQFDASFEMLRQYQDISEYDAIYIGGGNTFELLRKFKESGMYDQLRRHISEGKDVYGGSAGAILLGKTILTARGFDEEIHTLDSYEGVDVLQGYSVWPHYAEDQDEAVHEFCKKHDLGVIAISEEAGVIVGDSFRSVGRVYVFSESLKEVM